MKSVIKQKRQSGQIIIILLLIMLVGLSIGLTLTQRSVTDVTTSTQTEQSSRAFSAAEAGLEKALGGSIASTGSVTLDNDSSAQVDVSGLLPIAGTGLGIEYPPIGRETTAQFWFADPSSLSADPVSVYNSSVMSLYYGNPDTAATDKPAVEVNIVVQSNGKYYNVPYYFDSDPFRAKDRGNNFDASTCDGNQLLATGILGNGHRFYCSQAVSISDPDPAAGGASCATSTCKLVLARVRFLYINENHPVALAPNNGAQFPPQVQIYNTTGFAGQSQKQIQAFKVKDVVPPWFDFAVFSINELVK